MLVTQLLSTVMIRALHSVLLARNVYFPAMVSVCIIGLRLQQFPCWMSLEGMCIRNSRMHAQKLQEHPVPYGIACNMEAV